MSVKQPNATISTVEKNSKVYDGNGFNVSTTRGSLRNGNGVAVMAGYYTARAGDYIKLLSMERGYDRRGACVLLAAIMSNWRWAKAVSVCQL